MKFLVMLFATWMAGCSTTDMAYMDARLDPFIRTNYKAIDAMVDSIKVGGHELTPHAVIMVATLVNIDSLAESSKLGRTLAEQVQARLTQRGYSVIELKLRGQLFIQKEQGELLLTREVENLRKSHQADAVVVGTYAVARDYVYVNLKMVDADNLAVGAQDYTLPLDRNIKAMLKTP